MLRYVWSNSMLSNSAEPGAYKAFTMFLVSRKLPITRSPDHPITTRTTAMSRFLPISIADPERPLSE